MKTLFLLLLLVTLASCQTSLPSFITWEYNYTENSPPDNDSLNIIFDVFQGLSMIDTSFVLLDSTQALDLRLLTYSNLYQNQGYYLYCRARSLDDGAISFPSDTIYAYFPRIIAGEPYNIEVLKTELK